MKLKYLLIALLALALAGAVSAQSYRPTQDTFAYIEVENYTLHDINFTVPVEYELKDSGEDFLLFKHGKEKLKINAVKNGTIKKVNSTKKVKANTTLLGTQKGYLVDRNGSYTFSYHEGKYLVTIKSKNLPLVNGVMGKD